MQEGVDYWCHKPELEKYVNFVVVVVNGYFTYIRKDVLRKMQGDAFRNMFKRLKINDKLRAKYKKFLELD